MMCFGKVNSTELASSMFFLPKKYSKGAHNRIDASPEMTGKRPAR
jgi:hypothetical protein